MCTKFIYRSGLLHLKTADTPHPQPLLLPSQSFDRCMMWELNIDSVIDLAPTFIKTFNYFKCYLYVYSVYTGLIGHGNTLDIGYLDFTKHLSESPIVPLNPAVWHLLETDGRIIQESGGFIMLMTLTYISIFHQILRVLPRSWITACRVLGTGC